jgi:hypothetical protein
MLTKIFNNKTPVLQIFAKGYKLSLAHINYKILMARRCFWFLKKKFW